MSPPWQYPQDALPGDGDYVYITRLPYFDKPFGVKYDVATLTFIWTDTNSNQTYIPQWQVWKWRPS